MYLSFWSRESFETSFDSKQPKLEPKPVSALSETTRLFLMFRFYIKHWVSVFRFLPKRIEQIETNISLSTAACAASECVCSTTSSVLLDVYVLRQPLLPFDISVLQQPMLLLEISVLQQSVLLLDKGTECICSTAAWDKKASASFGAFLWSRVGLYSGYRLRSRTL